MEIDKGSRHQKIIGDFGENLIRNFLSRSGFEVTIVDHTGIDIVAYNIKNKKRYGITVKSRTRNYGKERDSVNILSYQKENDDRKKILNACESFNCEPWIAIYVETETFADLYLTSLENYDKNYKTSDKKSVDDWKMTEKYKKKYKNDKNIKQIHLDFISNNWEF